MRDSESEIQTRNGVVVLSGYGIRVAVEGGHLCVEDGVGAARRSARFPRASRELRRLVVLGHTGTISFDALRWLSDIGASFVQIDSDGTVIAATGPPGTRDARLRRAQALAHGNGASLVAAKSLVGVKIAGQRSLLDRLAASKDAFAVVDAAIKRVAHADDIGRLRLIEAEAANAYWNAWSTVSVQFTRQDIKGIPRHWKTLGRRASLVTGRSRKASNPANAALNYLYAIAEAEAKIAAIAVGLDPGLGVLHVDERLRDSLACDLMEPVRPAADRFLLDLLSSRTFRKRDFFETREGVCRIMPPLTNILAETAPRWAAAIAPLAEEFARQVIAGDDDGRKARRQPTPLTESNRSAGRKPRKKSTLKKQPVWTEVLTRTCVVCGSDLKRGRKQYCPKCKDSQARDAVSKAHASLRKRRIAGDDPAHGGEAARRRGRRNSETLQLNFEWERTNPGGADFHEFEQEIAPNLRSVSLSDLVRATGLSQPYCAMIRRGGRVPHPRHWRAIREIIQ